MTTTWFIDGLHCHYTALPISAEVEVVFTIVVLRIQGIGSVYIFSHIQAKTNCTFLGRKDGLYCHAKALP